MQGDAAFKVTLYFPLTDNDGEKFGREVWDWWHGEMTRVLSAFTDLGVVHGWWLGHSDQNRRISVVVKSEEEVDQIRKFLRAARIRFRQEKMYLEYHPTRFEEVS